jgi:hydrogenase nickel incorporation protein HypA/HybF
MDMHELTIVLNIVGIAEDQLAKQHGSKIEAIELEFGTLAGIEMEAFQAAWSVALPGSVLEEARLTIKQLDAIAKCRQCQQEYGIKDLYEACPQCGSFRYDLIQGKELKVNSLSIS